MDQRVPDEEQIIINFITIVENTVPKYLLEFIYALLNQSWGNWRCYILNNASTARRTLAILDEYSLKDARFVLLHEKYPLRDKDIAYQKLLQQVNIPYVAILNIDDSIASNTVVELVTLLKQMPKLNLITTDQVIVDDEGFFYPVCWKQNVPWQVTLAQKDYYLTLFNKISCNILTGKIDENSLYYAHLPLPLYHRRDKNSKLKKLRLANLSV